jgi:rubrerythrin
MVREMAEYIDREVAVDAIKKDVMGGLNYESILKRIPSADVQPVKHGWWKWSEGWQCSECGFHNSNFGYNYCPNCGARMDGET